MTDPKNDKKPALPNNLSCEDRFHLLFLKERLAKYEAQAAMLQVQVERAQHELGVFSDQLVKNYLITPHDTVDENTGRIRRGAAGMA